jgi:hypothetical protein
MIQAQSIREKIVGRESYRFCGVTQSEDLTKV